MPKGMKTNNKEHFTERESSKGHTKVCELIATLNSYEQKEAEAALYWNDNLFKKIENGLCHKTKKEAQQ